MDDLLTDDLIEPLYFYVQNSIFPTTEEWTSFIERFYKVWKVVANGDYDDATVRCFTVLFDGCEFTQVEYITGRFLEVILDGLIWFRSNGSFTEGMSHIYHLAIIRAGGRVIGPVSDLGALHE